MRCSKQRAEKSYTDHYFGMPERQEGKRDGEDILSGRVSKKGEGPSETEEALAEPIK